MLSFLLSTVNSTLLGSKGFFIASLLPVLLFSAAVFGLDVSVYPEHAKWTAEIAKDKPGTTLTAAVLALICAAYVFSGTNALLRELLEGRIFNLWILSWLRTLFLSVQRERHTKAREDFELRQREYWRQSREDWTAKLREDRVTGRATKQPPPLMDKSLEKRIEEVWCRDDLRDCGDALRIAVNDFGLAIQRFNADWGPEWNRLHQLLNETSKRYVAQLQDLRVEAYGKVAVYPEALRPTRLGNIAATLRSYARSRYGMELDVFWTRFQRLIDQDDKPASALQDAKIQLEFFVSMTWLCAVLSLGGSTFLALESDRWLLFLLTTGAGPLLAMLFYHLACESYRAFNEVFRGLVDVLRFKLIEAYHLALPAGSEEERHLWTELTNRIGYDSASGDVFYHHGK